MSTTALQDLQLEGTHENLPREIASLSEIVEEIWRARDTDTFWTPTPCVRSIIATMQAFQKKGNDLMSQINELVRDLLGGLTELSADPRLSEDQKKDIAKDCETQMMKQDD